MLPKTVISLVIIADVYSILWFITLLLLLMLASSIVAISSRLDNLPVCLIIFTLVYKVYIFANHMYSCSTFLNKFSAWKLCAISLPVWQFAIATTHTHTYNTYKPLLHLKSKHAQLELRYWSSTQMYISRSITKFYCGLVRNLSDHFIIIIFAICVDDLFFFC